MADLVSSVQIIATDETSTAYAAAAANTRELSQAVNAGATAGEQASQSFRKAAVSAHELGEARHAIRGLGEEIGVHMPRFVSTYLASLGPVAGIMSMAFAPIAIIGVVEMLGHLPKAIQGGIDSLRGWGTAAKKEFEDSIRFTHEMQKAVEDAADAEYKARMTAGKAGAGKTAAEEVVQNHMLGEALDRQTEAHTRILGLKKEIHELDAKNIVSTNPVTGTARAAQQAYQWLTDNKEHEQAEKLLEQAKKDYEEAQKAVVEAGSKRTVGIIEARPEAANEARKANEVRLEADRKYTESLISQREKSTKETYALDQMAAETEVAVLKGAAKDKADADRTYFDGRIALARQKERETGESQAAEIYSFQRQEEESRIAYWAAIEAIDNEGLKTQQKQMAEADKVGDAGYEHMLKQDTELGVAIGKMLDEDTEKRKRQAEEIAKIHLETGVAAAKSEAEMQRMTVNAAYDMGNISLAERVKRLKAVEEAEYRVAVMAAYQGAGAAVDDPVKTAEAEKKIQELTAAHNLAIEKINIDGAKKSEKPWDQYFHSLESNFNRSINSMITGQEKFRKAAQSLWQGLVTDSAQALEKMIEKQVIMEAKKLLAHTAAKEGEVAVDATAATESGAISGMSMIKEIAHAAAKAAANTWAAISSIPVVGPYLAPAAAAAALYGVYRLATMEEGGLSPRTQLTMIHAGESTYTQNQTTRIEKALGGNTTSNSSVNNHYHGYPGESPHSVTQNASAWKRAHRDGRLRFA
jgi:hypothetical protein